MAQNESTGIPSEFQTSEQFERLVNSLVRTQVEEFLQTHANGVEVGRIVKNQSNSLTKVFAIAGPILLTIIAGIWYLGVEFGGVSTYVMGINGRFDQMQMEFNRQFDQMQMEFSRRFDQMQMENNRRFDQIDDRLKRLEDHLIPPSDNTVK